ncbi:hypothetical protein DXG03_009075 [Asterophora parasitica]|uniref:Peptidase S8/S53 domain-containing protein n=1 Tax=Asterophora parasitica TaxID=117018 RepID=A0A9P7KB46_9AGAR|nr:hypothetical protein DXG03_009075 [Asterophora parasitica]
MSFFTSVFPAIVLAAAVFASPAPIRVVEKFNGEASGKYIVKLKDGVAKSKVFGQLKNSKVTHDWSVVHGFAVRFSLWGSQGQLSEDAVNVLRTSPDVEYIAEDGIITTCATQTNAPWGIARLSQPGKLANQNASDLTFSYTYDDSAGAGVDVYVVVQIAESALSLTLVAAPVGAQRSAATPTLMVVDMEPTLRLSILQVLSISPSHSVPSGTVAGSQYGVSKAANVIAVKVLSDSGSGKISDVISGLNWVASSVATSGRPSIATLSLAVDGISIPLDNTVSSLVSRGIHVTVAAGNSRTDANSTSPARAAGVITVGASTIADARASFSNYGAVVNVFAPGENIISAWIGSTTATNNLSGTSMATPHVAGLVAYFISKSGNSSPAAIAALIKSLSVKGALTGIPPGTANDLAQNGVAWTRRERRGRREVVR